MKWISVKDRLPEKSSDRLIITDGEYVTTGYFDEDLWCGLEDVIEITHWMMLPKPPKNR